MKWTEPYTVSIKHQEKLNLFSKEVLFSCLKWTALLLLLSTLESLASKDNFSQTMIRALWVAPTFGFALAWLIDIIMWLSPINISSGPAGIVCEKGTGLILFPWNQISSYEVLKLEGMSKLNLKLIDGTEHHFFIPKKVDISVIKKELESNLSGM